MIHARRRRPRPVANSVRDTLSNVARNIAHVMIWAVALGDDPLQDRGEHRPGHRESRGDGLGGRHRCPDDHQGRRRRHRHALRGHHRRRRLRGPRIRRGHRRSASTCVSPRCAGSTGCCGRSATARSSGSATTHAASPMPSWCSTSTLRRDDDQVTDVLEYGHRRARRRIPNSRTDALLAATSLACSMWMRTATSAECHPDRSRSAVGRRARAARPDPRRLHRRRHRLRHAPLHREPSSGPR